ncbi:OmpA family protein [Wenzhouxiangella sp. AB-CW3]|uniref:OmpA family protein n=1 Tax=Wenzhouxiangella sp. AB-CW3 TaxID=2771012 RepID=UPI00168B6C10|nr:OmpA family protein [Wenzhouxiangella sp. AB-CW3]QOC23970.1 OmpA family protein [Wenzhouxiangella sp. AB-CW3]
MKCSWPTRWIAVPAFVAVLAGCATTTDPWTGEERATRAGQGAAIGAGIGAVVGAVTGRDRVRRAAIGAGVGALSGAAIGSYMDRQEAELRRQLEGTGVGVTRRGDEIILNMPGNITFGFDSADLRPDFFEVLNSVALVLEEFDQTVLVVDGHTDSVGSHQYNMGLSQRRAETVGRYLVGQGVEPVRIATYGHGPDYPVASNENEVGRAQNRRVELTLMPVTAG